jgi:hypothetical protein
MANFFINYLCKDIKRFKREFLQFDQTVFTRQAN